MRESKCSVCYCGCCGDRQWTWTVCNHMGDCDDYDDDASNAEYYDTEYDNSDSDFDYPVTAHSW